MMRSKEQLFGPELSRSWMNTNGLVCRHHTSVYLNKQSHELICWLSSSNADTRRIPYPRKYKFVFKLLTLWPKEDANILRCHLRSVSFSFMRWRDRLTTSTEMSISISLKSTADEMSNRNGYSNGQVAFSESEPEGVSQSENNPVFGRVPFIVNSES